MSNKPLQTQPWRKITSLDRLTPAQREQVSAASEHDLLANTTEVVGELIQCTFEPQHTPAGARFAALRAESR